MFNQFPIAFEYDGRQYNAIRRRSVDWETDSPKCGALDFNLLRPYWATSILKKSANLGPAYKNA
jgi:hypothetical protein